MFLKFFLMVQVPRLFLLLLFCFCFCCFVLMFFVQVLLNQTVTEGGKIQWQWYHFPWTHSYWVPILHRMICRHSPIYPSDISTTSELLLMCWLLDGTVEAQRGEVICPGSHM